MTIKRSFPPLMPSGRDVRRDKAGMSCVTEKHFLEIIRPISAVCLPPVVPRAGLLTLQFGVVVPPGLPTVGSRGGGDLGCSNCCLLGGKLGCEPMKREVPARGPCWDVLPTQGVDCLVDGSQLFATPSKAPLEVSMGEGLVLAPPACRASGMH